jgi:hypothetical protein
MISIKVSSKKEIWVVEIYKNLSGRKAEMHGYSVCISQRISKPFP